MHCLSGIGYFIFELYREYIWHKPKLKLQDKFWCKTRIPNSVESHALLSENTYYADGLTDVSLVL